MQPGTTIENRFICLKRLGKGGMGEVYLAQDKAANGIEVAIKKINEVVQVSLRSEETFKRFQSEIAVCRSFKNPNIVEAKEVVNSSEEGLLYVMEYLPGGTLREKLLTQNLSVIDSVKILIGLCKGLISIHNAGLVHRDLKPENIFFDHIGTPKIGDFGLARVIGSNSLTTDRIVLGTVLYIPPEYIETGESDQRGDLYALGVIAFEMFTGKAPFVGRIAEDVTRAKFQPVSITPLIDADIDRELIAVTLKLMELRLLHRYQTAAEPLAVLESWLSVQEQS